MTNSLKKINLDAVSLEPQVYLSIESKLNTTRVLERLYGRKIAQKYFTSHFCFDTIKLTV